MRGSLLTEEDLDSGRRGRCKAPAPIRRVRKGMPQMAPAMRRRRSPVLPACQFRAVSRILKQLIAENQQLGQSVLAVRNRTRDAACRPLALSPPHVVAASAASAAPSHGGSRGGDGLAAGRPAMPGLGRTFRRQPAQVAASSWKGPETGTEKAPPPGPLSRCGMLRPPGMPNTVRPADAGIRSGTAMSTAISHTGNTGRRGASGSRFRRDDRTASSPRLGRCARPDFPPQAFENA